MHVDSRPLAAVAANGGGGGESVERNAGGGGDSGTIPLRADLNTIRPVLVSIPNSNRLLSAHKPHYRHDSLERFCPCKQTRRATRLNAPSANCSKSNAANLRAYRLRRRLSAAKICIARPRARLVKPLHDTSSTARQRTRRLHAVDVARAARIRLFALVSRFSK